MIEVAVGRMTQRGKIQILRVRTWRFGGKWKNIVCGYVVLVYSNNDGEIKRGRSRCSLMKLPRDTLVTWC